MFKKKIYFLKLCYKIIVNEQKILNLASLTAFKGVGEQKWDKMKICGNPPQINGNYLKSSMNMHLLAENGDLTSHNLFNPNSCIMHLEDGQENKFYIHIPT